MKNFVRFYYCCSFKVGLCAFLLFIGLTVLSSSAFAQQYGDFNYTVSDNKVIIIQYTGPGGNVLIPNTIDGMPVVGIGDYTFFGCDGLTSVTIPKSVTSIGQEVFAYCYGLTSIVVDTNNAVYSSQDGVLYNKAKTVLIQYPGGKAGGFTIPSSVISIGDSAFYYCNRLTSVTIPNSVTNIGELAFAYCYNLTSMNIPNSVISIGDHAFEYCIGLTSVTIPDSVTSIGQGAFDFSHGLTSVIIGNSVTSIGHYAFGSCSSLTSIVVDTSNPVYSSQDGVLYNKAKTVLIQYPGGKSGGFTIPDGVKSIEMDSFFGCDGLTNVTIPNSVTSIGGDAFAVCSGLVSVTIGNSVTRIGGMAFNNCPNLTRAYFNGNAPSIGSWVFSYCASNFSICYTAGSTGFTTPTWCPLSNPCYPASVCGETLIELSLFNASPGFGKVALSWSTESEIDNAGFNLYRSEKEDGEYTKINSSLIPAQGSSTEGASYEFVDKDVKNRKPYWYKLEDIDLNGVSAFHGPVSATPRLIFKLKKSK